MQANSVRMHSCNLQSVTSAQQARITVRAAVCRLACSVRTHSCNLQSVKSAQQARITVRAAVCRLACSVRTHSCNLQSVTSAQQARISASAAVYRLACSVRTHSCIRLPHPSFCVLNRNELNESDTRTIHALFGTISERTNRLTVVTEAVVVT